MRKRYLCLENSKRRGSVAPLVAISATVLIGFAALAIDVGALYSARAETQRTADAAALAATMELLDQEALSGRPNMCAEESAARTLAVSYASKNPIRGVYPTVDPNPENLPGGDVVVGYLFDPSNLAEPLTINLPNMMNSVQVRVHRDSQRNGQIPTFFARLFGIDGTNMVAQATATFKDGCVGFKLSAGRPNCSLMPFALKVTTWEDFIAGKVGLGDHYAYDKETGQVTAGVGDGIPELNLYPGAGAEQLTPGNFGTVDIGASNNSSNDIKRQILDGVSFEDLNRAPFWGEVKLGADGTLLLNADTGLSAGFKAELEAIKGKPRTIVLFRELVGGNGNNTNYVIVGFAGIRIVNVKLTGSMNSKEVLIQPAHVVDPATISGEGQGASYFVYQPVRITR